MTAREAWEDVLGALERDLAAMQQVIDDLDQGATAPAPEFRPPADLGPMPADLAARAIGLAAAYETALERAQAESARLAEELRRLPRGHAPQPGPAVARTRIDYSS
jgi:hypothetical protein